MRIIVVGSSNTDLVLRCDRLPKPGETYLGGEFARFAGGKGANQAVAAARAGAEVHFIGAHGLDEFGRTAKAALRAEGIHVSHFRECADAPSGVALILVGGKKAENLIGVARSANDLLSPSDIKKARSLFRKADAVVCQLEIPVETVLEAACIAHENNVPFILNPAPARKISRELLQRTTVLTPNEHEAAMLTGHKRLDGIAKKFFEFGCASTIITLGARGALVCELEGKAKIMPPKVSPVDTVGAGDCFTAWVAVGVAEGMPLVEAARRAVKAAALSTTRSGAQSGMPTREEVERL